MEKHTLVLPLSPNIVSLFMSWLIATKDEIRRILDVVDAPALKFIPAGPLRKEDWPGQAALNAKSLAEKGYLFLDCGAGEYDRHVLPEHESRVDTSSLDLLDHDIGLAIMAPHLLPLADIIRDQDVNGARMAFDPRLRASSTPHTARHLKSIIVGWKLRHADPAVVVKLSRTAFSGIETLISEKADELVVLPPEDQAKEVRKMFLYDRLLQGVHGFLTAAHAFDPQGRKPVDIEAEDFRSETDNALQIQEEEWNDAVKDYLAGSTAFRSVDVGGSKLTVVIGTSDSERYQQVARYGNEGPSDRRPHGGKFRPKANVVIQFYRSAGRFHIATDGVYLDEVVKLLREADLKYKGVTVTPEIRAKLGQTGDLFVKNDQGAVVETLYFPVFRKGAGSNFRSNPNGAICLVPTREIVDLTLRGLAAQQV